MSETKETTDRRQGGGRKPVSSQRTEHSGHVQQNFSHGRKNVVVVERKKTRKIQVPGEQAGGGAAASGGRAGGRCAAWWCGGCARALVRRGSQSDPGRPAGAKAPGGRGEAAGRGGRAAAYRAGEGSREAAAGSRSAASGRGSARRCRGCAACLRCRDAGWRTGRDGATSRFAGWRASGSCCSGRAGW